MKKINFFLISLSIILLSTNGVFAQEIKEDPGIILPSNPFYDLDLFGEQIRLLFTADPNLRARLHLRYAQERIDELSAMTKKSVVESKFYERGRTEYENAVTKSSQEISLVVNETVKNDLYLLVQQQTEKHLAVLERVKLQVPEQALKGIENAIANSQKMKAIAVKSYSEVKKT